VRGEHGYATGIRQSWCLSRSSRACSGFVRYRIQWDSFGNGDGRPGKFQIVAYKNEPLASLAFDAQESPDRSQHAGADDERGLRLLQAEERSRLTHAFQW